MLHITSYLVNVETDFQQSFPEMSEVYISEQLLKTAGAGKTL